jgi:hypothetical protein
MHVCSRLFLNGFSANLLGTYYDSPQVARTTYFSCSRTARACERLTFAYLWTDSLQIRWTHTTHDHKLHGIHTVVCSCTALTRGSVCASARVIKRSLIYGRILFKVAVNILQITTSSMGCVLFMFTHRVHVCERTCASARMVHRSFIFGQILFTFAGNYYKSPQVACATYFSCSRAERMRASTCVRARPLLSIRLSLDGFSPNLVKTYNGSSKLH